MQFINLLPTTHSAPGSVGSEFRNKKIFEAAVAVLVLTIESSFLFHFYSKRLNFSLQ